MGIGEKNGKFFSNIILMKVKKGNEHEEETVPMQAVGIRI